MTPNKNLPTQTTSDTSITRLGAVRLCLLLAALLLGRVEAGDDRDTTRRVRNIERGLVPLYSLSGESAPRMRLRERMQHYGVPGVSIAVIHNGKLDWAGGYGFCQAGGRYKVNKETIFQAASISKPVTAVGALRLVELRKLSLDVNVNTYLSAWRIPENEHTHDQKVTLRRILSHNAGLSVHGFDGYQHTEPVPTLLQVLDGMSPANSRPVRIELVPGADFRYSGGAYSVLQLLMSEIEGESFEQLMRKLVLVPAGMLRSSFAQPLPDRAARNAASGHAADGKLIPGRFHVYPEQAAAGLWSTPSDLAKLAVQVQMSARGLDGGVLSPATIREMLRVHAGSYGLGFGVGGEGRSRFFVHPGGNAGFRAILIAFTEVGSGAVVMTNSDNGMQLAFEILRAIACVYEWPKTGWSALETIEKRRIVVEAEELRRFAGVYKSDTPGPTQLISVTLDGDSLKVRLPGWKMGRTAHASAPTAFFFLDTPIELTFEVDHGGGVIAVVVSDNGQKKRAIRM